MSNLIEIAIQCFTLGGVLAVTGYRLVADYNENKKEKLKLAPKL